MSGLITDRIRESASRLGLSHLTEVITDLVERAEAGQMGYLDFVDLLLKEELGRKLHGRRRGIVRLASPRGAAHSRAKPRAAA